MTLFQRFGYFSIGLCVGIVFLIFFLSGKKTSCSYSPNARVLKNIRLKKRNISSAQLTKLQSYQLDTSDVSYVLKHGSVDFSKSNTELDTCKTYWIAGTTASKITLQLTVANCEKAATIQSLTILD